MRSLFSSFTLFALRALCTGLTLFALRTLCSSVTLFTLRSLCADSAVCNCKCSCRSVRECYQIGVDKILAFGFDDRSDSYALVALVTLVTLVALIALIALGTLCSGLTFITLVAFFSVCTVFAVRTYKREQPLLKGTFISVFNRKLVYGFAVSSVLTVSSVFTVGSVFAVSSVFTGLTLRSVRTGRTYKREQPFLDRSLISKLNCKLVRALSVRAVRAVRAILTCKRCYPFLKGTRVASARKFLVYVVRILVYFGITFVFFCRFRGGRIFKSVTRGNFLGLLRFGLRYVARRKARQTKCQNKQ